MVPWCDGFFTVMTSLCEYLAQGTLGAVAQLRNDSFEVAAHVVQVLGVRMVLPQDAAFAHVNLHHTVT